MSFISLQTMLLFTFAFAQPRAAEPLPFKVCAQSTTWVRPSPEVQAKVWNDPRYKAFARTTYEWTHNFIVLSDPMSTGVRGYYSEMSGVWTNKPQKLAPDCAGIPSLASPTEWIEVWSLLYRVTAVTHEGTTYTFTVQHTGRGFQWIYIKRMDRSEVLRFVTPDGKELERWDEASRPNAPKDTFPPGLAPLPVIVK